MTHAAAAAVSSPGFFPYLAAVSRPLAITVTVYYGIKAVVLLAASIVAMRTENEGCRKACVEIVGIVCRGWPWPPLLPGGSGDVGSVYPRFPVYLGLSYGRTRSIRRCW